VKKKIYIHLSNSIINKEYLEFFPFAELSKNYQVIPVFGKVIFDQNLDFIQVRFFRITRTLHALNHYCIMWYRRYSSLAFKLRAYQYFGSRTEIRETSNFGIYNGRRHETLTLIFVRILGNRVGIVLLNKTLNACLRIESKRKHNNLSLSNSLMVLPYHGGISLEFDYLVWLSQKFRAKSVAIQQNWDNVSSKSFLLKHPDYFLTWGSQSSSHLRTIQNFRGNLREVGCFRFNEIYREKSRLHSISQYSRLPNDSKYKFKILIVGTGPGNFDHELVISVIDAIKRGSMNEFQITYRPHPFRISKSDMATALRSLPDLNIDIAKPDEKNIHRIKIIMDSDVVVSLYSTVLLESTILNKACVIPSFITGPKGYNTGYFVDDLSHYSGISSFGNIHVVNTSQEFLSTLNELQYNNVKIQTEERLLNWFCKNTNTSKDIFNILTEILN